MICKIYNSSINEMPSYASEKSAGIDLRANISERITIKPLERRLIPTGLFMELPHDCEAQIRPRSGLALKHGITVLNSPGTIDADYRGEIQVLLINLSDKPFDVENGDRIAQMIIAKYTKADIVEVSEYSELSETERGAGGFGHSGRK